MSKKIIYEHPRATLKRAASVFGVEQVRHVKSRYDMFEMNRSRQTFFVWEQLCLSCPSCGQFLEVDQETIHHLGLQQAEYDEGRSTYSTLCVNCLCRSQHVDGEKNAHGCSCSWDYVNQEFVEDDDEEICHCHHKCISTLNPFVPSSRCHCNTSRLYVFKR